MLTEKMRQIGLPNKLSVHIHRLYCTRSIFIKTCDKLIGPRQTSIGLPQGSILSPILYIIYSYDFDLLFTDTNIKVYQFADDYAVRTQGKNINQCNTTLEDAIKKAEIWFDRNGSPIT